MYFKFLFLTLFPIYLLSNVEKSNPLEEKTIFLTFDDGPTYGTDNILAVIEEEKVAATLFIVGMNVIKNKDTYQRILTSKYATIANHTYSHANGKYREFYDNADKVFNDVNKNNQILVNAQTIEETKLLPLRLAGRNVFRLPNLSANDYSLPKEQRLNEHSKYNTLHAQGYHIFGWDIEWEYTQEGKVKTTPNQLANQIEYLYKHKRSKIQNKIILLMHDFTFTNRLNGKENLRTLIKLLKKRGWKFETISNYL